MCVAVGVLPVTGQTLPFISYGGTAYIFLGCGLGVIQSVAADVYGEKKKELPETEPQVAVEGEGMVITDDTDNEEKQV